MAPAVVMGTPKPDPYGVRGSEDEPRRGFKVVRELPAFLLQRCFAFGIKRA